MRISESRQEIAIGKDKIIIFGAIIIIIALVFSIVFIYLANQPHEKNDIDKEDDDGESSG